MSQSAQFWENIYELMAGDEPQEFSFGTDDDPTTFGVTVSGLVTFYDGRPYREARLYVDGERNLAVTQAGFDCRTGDFWLYGATGDVELRIPSITEVVVAE